MSTYCSSLAVRSDLPGASRLTSRRPLAVESQVPLGPPPGFHEAVYVGSS